MDPSTRFGDDEIPATGGAFAGRRALARTGARRTRERFRRVLDRLESIVRDDGSSQLPPT